MASDAIPLRVLAPLALQRAEPVRLTRDVVKRNNAFRKWFTTGRPLAGQDRGVMTRFLELSVEVCEISEAIRYPLRSNKAPKYLRYTVPPAGAKTRIVSAMNAFMTSS